jgi:hypothetical protein
MTALIRLGDLPTFSSVPELRAARNLLLTTGQEITGIADQVDADYTGKWLGQAAALLLNVEQSRTDVKAPVLDLARAIDAIAKEITTPLAHEKDRVQRLLGQYLEVQRRARAEAEAKLRAEEARRLAEAAKEKDDGKAAEAMRAIVQQTNAAVAVVTPPKIEGTSLRMQTTVEVFNPAALYAAHPYLVELKPRLAAIKEALLTVPNLPGVRVTQTPMATVRTTTQNP